MKKKEWGLSFSKNKTNEQTKHTVRLCIIEELLDTAVHKGVNCWGQVYTEFKRVLVISWGRHYDELLQNTAGYLCYSCVHLMIRKLRTIMQLGFHIQRLNQLCIKIFLKFLFLLYICRCFFLVTILKHHNECLLSPSTVFGIISILQCFKESRKMCIFYKNTVSFYIRESIDCDIHGWSWNHSQGMTNFAQIQAVRELGFKSSSLKGHIYFFLCYSVSPKIVDFCLKISENISYGIFWFFHFSHIQDLQLKGSNE